MRRAIIALALMLEACDGGAGDPDPVVVPTPIDATTVAMIRGKVTFNGTPAPNPKLPVGGSAECSALHDKPVVDEIVLVKGGRLQNVFVYVKEGLEGKVFAWPKEAVKVSNRKCIYTPRISGAQVHQPIEFANEDPTDHNIHGYREAGDFNFTLRASGASRTDKMRKPEVMMKLRCDIHPWMIGYVGVVPHPFFQVTGEDGTFTLQGLPPGDYTLEAWHEKYGTKTLKAKLDVQGSLDVEFVYSEK